MICMEGVGYTRQTSGAASLTGKRVFAPGKLFPATQACRKLTVFSFGLETPSVEEGSIHADGLNFPVLLNILTIIAIIFSTIGQISVIPS